MKRKDAGKSTILGGFFEQMTIIFYELKTIIQLIKMRRGPNCYLNSKCATKYNQQFVSMHFRRARKIKIDFNDGFTHGLQ